MVYELMPKRDTPAIETFRSQVSNLKLNIMYHYYLSQVSSEYVFLSN